MEAILRLDKIAEYNLIKGVETLHPLVSIIDNSVPRPALPNGKVQIGFYAVFLKETKCGELRYGRNNYDYEEGTLLFIGPGQIIGINNDENYQAKGWTLIFHPELIRGTELSQNIKNYSFFSYELTEALHLSERERHVITDILKQIKFELQNTIDKHSKTLITSSIELLLNYCTRFYDRQFITRENINKGVLERFEQELETYLQSGKPQILGLPSVAYFADLLNLSSNYFGDLVKKETGKSAQEFIHHVLINAAKDKIFDTNKTVNEIAYELGFKYPQHFSRMFKKEVGMSPSDYRILN
jgi:AraC family transcriptional regulator, transcriptional activator of pobA